MHTWNQPTHAEAAVVRIHFSFVCCFFLKYTCSVFCLHQLKSEIWILCYRQFLPPSHSPWTGRHQSMLAQFTYQWHIWDINISEKKWWCWSSNNSDQFVVVVDLIVLVSSVLISFSRRVKFTLRSIMFFSMLYKWSDNFIWFLNPFFFSLILQTNIIWVTQRASLNLLLLNIAQCSPPL